MSRCRAHDPEFRSRSGTVADNPSEFVRCRSQKFNSNINCLPTLVDFVDSSKPKAAILPAKRLVNTPETSNRVISNDAGHANPSPDCSAQTPVLASASCAPNPAHATSRADQGISPTLRPSSQDPGKGPRSQNPSIIPRRRPAPPHCLADLAHWRSV